MQVTMKNSEINAALNRLSKVVELDLSLPAVVSYRIAQNEKALREARGPYDEAVKGIFAKYAKGSDVIDRKTDPAAYEGARKEIAELDNLEAEVEIHTFPLKLIETREDIPLSVYLALEIMISDGGNA